MKTKEFTKVPGLEPEDKVIIKRLDYGEKQDVSDEATEISIINNKQSVNVKLGKTKIWMLIIGVIEAPFFKGLTTNEQKYNVVRGLSQETGDFLFLELNKINAPTMDEETKKNLNSL